MSIGPRYSQSSQASCNTSHFRRRLRVDETLLTIPSFDMDTTIGFWKHALHARAILQGFSSEGRLLTACVSSWKGDREARPLMKSSDDQYIIPSHHRRSPSPYRFDNAKAMSSTYQEPEDGLCIWEKPSQQRGKRRMRQWKARSAEGTELGEIAVKHRQRSRCLRTT
jgi:hypothetical protein